MINKIYQGIKRLLFGSTYKFTTRKGSGTFNGASWTELYRETLKYPMKLISIEILVEKDIMGEFRVCVDGQKVFPFTEFSKIESGVTRNFLIPVSIAAGSFIQIEVRGAIKSKAVIILSELAIIEVI